MARSKAVRGAYWVGIRWLVASGAIALLTVGGWWAYRRHEQQPPEAIAVEAVTVEQAVVEDLFSGSGTLELGDQQVLTAPSQGTVEQVLVAVGDRVEAGQTLLQLRAEDLADDTRTEELEIAQAQVNLQKSEQELRQAEIKLDQARQALRKEEELEARGFVAQDDVTIKQDEVREQEGLIENQALEIQNQQLTLAAARIKLAQKQETIGEALAASRIVSPITGKVLAVAVQPGAGIEIAKPVITLGDPRREVVKVQIPPLNAQQVRVGQVARVKAIGPDATEYPGRVVDIAPTAATSESDSNPFGQGGQAAVATVIALDRPTGSLIPLSQVDVTIVLERSRSGPVIDVGLIQEEAGQSYVWVRDRQGLAQRQPVQVGLQGIETAAILAGLKPGDQVLRPPLETPLTVGMPVELADPATATPDAEAATP
jgi:HlyD family secretion protein